MHVLKAVDKSAEIMSAVCQKAREKKIQSMPSGMSMFSNPDTSNTSSTISTLRATVTGKSDSYILMQLVKAKIDVQYFDMRIEHQR